MGKVVPSQIIEFIDNALPSVQEAQVHKVNLMLSYQQIGFIRGLSDLLSKLDDHLLPVGTSYVLLEAATSEIRAKLEAWTRGERSKLEKMAGHKENPVIVIRRILEHCPDSAVPPSISGLEFISDPIYREHLREELTSIEQLFEARQWKATIVLAGSLMEALLCDQITRKSHIEITDAVSALISKKDLKQNLQSDPLTWHLPEYLKVAEKLQIIRIKTKEQALLSADFRNLVHPGKALRDQITCDRAATFSVLAGLEHVIKDLSMSHGIS
jgi:hypothetical protein